MKKSKLALITGILGIVIISLISFVGIYIQKETRMENVVKDFNYSKDVKGYREIRFKLSEDFKVLDENGKVVGDTSIYNDELIEQNKYVKSEEKVNSEESINAENFEKTKQYFENRLKAFGVEDYNISVDKQTGEIYIQLPEDSNTNRVISNITEIGSVEIKDSESGEVLIKNEDFKKAAATYGSTSKGTIAGLELQFNKEGTEILRNLSENEYKTIEKSDDEEETEEENEEETEEETKEENEGETEEEAKEENSENETSSEEKQKQIAIYISGSETVKKNFDKPILNGKISDLSIGQPTTDKDTLNSNLQTASQIVAVLNNGPLPLKYSVKEDTNHYVQSNISRKQIKEIEIAVAVCLAILLVYMIIKYKLRGILSAICYIGFIALYLLLLRYTNVVISLEGIIGMIIIALINYYMSMKLLEVKSENKKEYDEQFLKAIYRLIPIFIISIAFCFVKLTVIKSAGMVMFWGLVLMLSYNRLTKNIID